MAIDSTCTTAPAMKIADMMVAAKAWSDSAGIKGLAAMIGTCTIAVSGVKMKPIAARCGSRLNSTLCDAETRASASPRMKP